ncbi:hypothetical protein ACFQZI_07185 [Mucilaginibacter lutimaris]|uniref:DUF1269 domain-containing protein n=1 Tax=Mucilaginibacter lutimaris TaxID=931629 RepID=A0ABW2ZEM1_9SPHI
MDNDKQYFLSGLFTEMSKAEKAYSELLAMGYKPEEVNVAMASTTRDKLQAAEMQIGTPETALDQKYDGTIDGGITGGLLGSIAFTIGALGSNLLIPGLGLVVMGPLAAGLLGAGAGGLTGGIIGKLLSPGAPEPQSELITQGLKNGKIMLALVPRNAQEEKAIHAKWTALDAEIFQKPIDNKLHD